MSNSETSLISLDYQFEFTSTGVIVKGDVSYDDLVEVTKQWICANHISMWVIGDLLNLLKLKYDETYEIFEGATGYKRQTLKIAKYVTGVIEPFRRLNNLPFYHHLEVASLPPDAQDRWLDIAEAEGLTQKQLRKGIKDNPSGLPPEQPSPLLDEDTDPNLPKLGEWWQLGKHKLYCGDTSKSEFWEQLPNVPFAFADPPYNANVADWDNDFNWDHDWLTQKAQVVAVTPGISSLSEFAQLTTMPYKWAMSAWIKNGMSRGLVGYGNWIYVPLFSSGSVYRQAQDHFNVTISTKSNGSDGQKRRKPQQFMEHMIKLFAKQGEIVIDPFLGTGTTLFVANQLGRICIGGEIEPKDCKAIIKRWQDETGKTAERYK
jgi:hypothetical protein